MHPKMQSIFYYPRWFFPAETNNYWVYFVCVFEVRLYVCVLAACVLKRFIVSHLPVAIQFLLHFMCSVSTVATFALFFYERRKQVKWLLPALPNTRQALTMQQHGR